jgi:hypothetical protein
LKGIRKNLTNGFEIAVAAIDNEPLPNERMGMEANSRRPHPSLIGIGIQFPR